MSGNERQADIASRLVELARKKGADEADALVITGTAIEVDVQDGHADKVERAESSDAGLRVIVNKAEAVVSGSRFDGDSLERLAERAVDMAKAAPADDTAGLADPARLAKRISDLDLADGEEPDAEKLMDLALRAEEAGLRVEGVSRSSGASASAGRRSIVLVASNGFAGSYERTSRGLSVSMVAGSDTAMERDYDYLAATHAADLKTPEELGHTAGERTVKRLNPQKVKTCKVPVVFEQRLAGGLVSHLASAINGNAIARGTSFLKERMGERLFPASVTVMDDPLRRRGLASRPFDAEGCAVKPRAVIDEGVLKTWLLDCRTARKLGLRTTGHAARGVSTGPSPSPSNLYMTPGSVSFTDLIAPIKQGFFVTELIGMGVNSVTGDYSRGASGFWIEDGKVTYPVSELTIASNLIDMYQGITAADDLRFRGSINAPSLRIEEMTVAGR